ncbi:MAG: prepilin-type N-terminal cleavage/methylation domain-containing protein [Planctomycetes bacterium]|nr:prepilin-type N-terminal cleavage/methylation domain-containing protein [Planctomycetota bacterium]
MKTQAIAGNRGFTLIEILVALVLTGLIMTSVFGVLHDALQARDHIHNVSQTQRTGPLILDLIESDLRALAPFNIAQRRVFLGKKNSIGGSDADTFDFVACKSAISDMTVSDGALGRDRSVHAPLCEIGYKLKRNTREPVFIELWRREDPLVDDDPFSGGIYTKIYDKLTAFHVTYFSEAGSQTRAEDQWSSEEAGALPQRMKIEIDLEIEPRVESMDRNADFSRRRSFARIFNIDSDINRVLVANLRPVVPDKAPTDDTQAGGGPGGGPGGKAGPQNGFTGAGGMKGGLPGGKSGLPPVFNSNKNGNPGNPFGGGSQGKGGGLPGLGGGKAGGGLPGGGLPGGGFPGGGKK